MSVKMNIPFSPPDISEDEINEVVDTLKSGWITTGPKTKELERQLRDYTGAAGLATFSSATCALESILRLLEIGPGDEVIVPAYTYTASASPIVHVGATPVIVDIQSDSFEMDYDAMSAAITSKTKAVIPVDLGGTLCDFDRIYAILEQKKNLWHPKAGSKQELFDRAILITDDAHALGASYKGTMAGNIADFSTFSFHAVKNFTTAEGGALSWRAIPGLDNDAFYHETMLMQLHGQSKDALSKNKAGAWEYDVVFPGYKCNMTDIQAAIGLAQLRRYPGMLERRKQMIETYEEKLSAYDLEFLDHYTDQKHSSGHLMITRLTGKSMEFRNLLIQRMAEEGVGTNVHYKPLPLLSAYANLGFDIKDYPNAYAHFANEITLPLNTRMTDEELAYVCDTFARCYDQLVKEGVE